MCVNVNIACINCCSDKWSTDNRIGNWHQSLMSIIFSIGIYRLFLKDVTNIVKSTSIMSFLVINCLYDTHSYWKNAHFHWKNQKPEGRYNIGLVSVTCVSVYWFIRISVKSLIDAPLVVTCNIIKEIKRLVFKFLSWFIKERLQNWFTNQFWRLIRGLCVVYVVKEVERVLLSLK